MQKKTKPLAHLSKDHSGTISDIHGGNGFRKKLLVMGIRKGQKVKIISKQPLMGPLTILIGNSQMTMGRKMAHKIFVEEL